MDQNEEEEVEEVEESEVEVEVEESEEEVELEEMELEEELETEWVEETYHTSTGDIGRDSNSMEYDDFEEELSYVEEDILEEEWDGEEVEEEDMSDAQVLYSLESSFRSLVSRPSNIAPSLATVDEEKGGKGSSQDDAKPNLARRSSIASAEFSVDDSASVDFDLGSYQDDMSSSSHKPPADYEQACRDLLAIVHQGEAIDIEDMLRRCDLPNLYTNLKQQHKHMMRSNSNINANHDTSAVDDDDSAWETFDESNGNTSSTSMFMGGPFINSEDPDASGRNPASDISCSNNYSKVADWGFGDDAADPWLTTDDDMGFEAANMFPKSAATSQDMGFEKANMLPKSAVTSQDIGFDAANMLPKSSANVGGTDEPTEVSMSDGEEFDDSVHRNRSPMEDIQPQSAASTPASLTVSAPKDKNGDTKPKIERWLDRHADEPDDYVQACRQLVATIYKGDENHDADTMLQRTPPRDLYRYLEHHYWYLVHMGELEENANAIVHEVEQEPVPAALELNASAANSLEAKLNLSQSLEAKLNLSQRSVESAQRSIQSAQRSVESASVPQNEDGPHEIEEEKPTMVEAEADQKEVVHKQAVRSVEPQLIQEDRPVNETIVTRETDQKEDAPNEVIDEDAEPSIEKWLERNDDDPEDFELGCRKLIPILYKGHEDRDPDTMLRRASKPEELYRYLKNQQWYLVHNGELDENAVADESKSELAESQASIDNTLSARLAQDSHLQTEATQTKGDVTAATAVHSNKTDQKSNPVEEEMAPVSAMAHQDDPDMWTEELAGATSMALQLPNATGHTSGSLSRTDSTRSSKYGASLGSLSWSNMVATSDDDDDFSSVDSGTSSKLEWSSKAAPDTSDHSITNREAKRSLLESMSNHDNLGDKEEFYADDQTDSSEQEDEQDIESDDLDENGTEGENMNVKREISNNGNLERKKPRYSDELDAMSETEINHQPSRSGESNTEAYPSSTDRDSMLYATLSDDDDHSFGNSVNPQYSGDTGDRSGLPSAEAAMSPLTPDHSAPETGHGIAHGNHTVRKAKREKLLKEELDAIIKQTEEEQLGEPFEPEAVHALKVAAAKVSYLKMYYDVLKNEFIYLPPVAKTIINYSLLDEAENHYFDEEDEFPVEYSEALRSIATLFLQDDYLDYDYMEKLAVEIGIGEEDLVDLVAHSSAEGDRDEVVDGANAGAETSGRPSEDHESTQRKAEVATKSRSISKDEDNASQLDSEEVQQPNHDPSSETVVNLSDGKIEEEDTADSPEQKEARSSESREITVEDTIPKSKSVATIEVNQEPTSSTALSSIPTQQDQSQEAPDETVEESRLQEMTQILEFKRRVDKSKLTEDAKALEELRKQAESKIALETKRLEDKRRAAESRLAEETSLLQEKHLVDEAQLEEEFRQLELWRISEEEHIADDAQALEENRQTEEDRLENETRAIEEKRLADEALFSQKNQVLRGRIQSARANLEAEKRRAEEERLADLEAQASQTEEKAGGFFGVFGNRKKGQDLEKQKDKQAKLMQQKLKEIDLEKEIQEFEANQDKLQEDVRKLEQERVEQLARLDEEACSLEQDMFAAEAKLADETRFLEKEMIEAEAPLHETKLMLEETRAEDEAWVAQEKMELIADSTLAQANLAEDIKEQRNIQLKGEDRINHIALSLKEKWLKEEAALAQEVYIFESTRSLKAEEKVKLQLASEAPLQDDEETLRKPQVDKQRKTKEQARLKAVEGARLLAELARLKAEEAARLKAEDDLRLKAEEEARVKLEEELKLKAEEEARLKAQEELLWKAEEEARLKLEEELQLKADEEPRLNLEEEHKVKADEEARLTAEEELQLKAEEEDRLKLEEELEVKAGEEARLKAEDKLVLKAEEEARLKLEEELQFKAEEEARLQLEEEPQLKAEEEARLNLEEEHRVKADEEARLTAEEELQLKAEEEDRLKLEEELKVKAEEEARLKAEDELLLKAEEEARLKLKEELDLKAEEEARLQLEEELQLKAEEEARLKLEEEHRVKAEEEVHLKAEEELQLKAEEEDRLKLEEELEVKAGEEPRLKAEDELLLKAEKEARLKLEEELELKAEEEARFQLEEELQLKADEETRLNLEEEHRVKAEEEARSKAEEELQLKAEEEDCLKLEEELEAKADEEARLKLEEELQFKAEEEARLQLEEELQLKAEEEDRLKLEEELKVKAEEEARLKAEDKLVLKAEEEARLKLEEELQFKAEEEARLQLEEELQFKADEEARLKLEEEHKVEAEEEARLKAEEELQLKAEEDDRLKLEEELKVKAEEEARLKAEDELLLKAEEEARLQLEEELQFKAQEEARLQLEEDLEVKTEEEACLKAEAEEEARLQLEEDLRLKAAEAARLQLGQELQLKAEEEARLKQEVLKAKAEEEARLKVEGELQLKAEEEDRLKVEEDLKVKAEEEARLKAEDELLLKAEEEACLQLEELQFMAEEEARLQLEEDRKVKVEEEARLQLEEDLRLKAAEAARLQLEEELKVKSEEEARLKQEVLKVKAQEEARLIADEEAARLKVEEEVLLKLEEELQSKAEEEARLNTKDGARREAEEEVRVKAATDARLKTAEGGRQKAEEEARLKTEEEVCLKAVEEATAETARLQAEEEARLKAEEDEAAHEQYPSIQTAEPAEARGREIPDHLVSVSQPKPADDTGSLGSTEMFDPPQPPRPAKPLLAAALKAKEAQERNASSFSDLSRTVPVEDSAMYKEFSKSVPDHLMSVNQPEPADADETGSLGSTEMFDPPQPPRPAKPLLAAALKVKEVQEGNARSQSSLDGTTTKENIPVPKRHKRKGVGLGNRLLKEAQIFMESSQKSLSFASTNSHQMGLGDSSLKVLGASGQFSAGAAAEKKPEIPKSFGPGRRIILLSSSTPINRLQDTNQERSLVLLKAHGIDYEVLDGADPDKKNLRDSLFAISGARGRYPQFFVLDDKGLATFFGTFETIEDVNDAGNFHSTFARLSTSTEKTLPSATGSRPEGQNEKFANEASTKICSGENFLAVNQEQSAVAMNSLPKSDTTPPLSPAQNGDREMKSERIMLTPAHKARLASETRVEAAHAEKSHPNNEIPASQFMAAEMVKIADKTPEKPSRTLRNSLAFLDASNQRTVPTGADRAAAWAKATAEPQQAQIESNGTSVWSPDRLAWWRKNGKRLVNEKLGITSPESEGDGVPDPLKEEEAQRSEEPPIAIDQSDRQETRGNFQSQSVSPSSTLAEKRRRAAEARERALAVRAGGQLLSVPAHEGKTQSLENESQPDYAGLDNTGSEEAKEGVNAPSSSMRSEGNSTKIPGSVQKDDQYAPRDGNARAAEWAKLRKEQPQEEPNEAIVMPAPPSPKRLEFWRKNGKHLVNEKLGATPAPSKSEESAPGPESLESKRRRVAEKRRAAKARRAGGASSDDQGKRENAAPSTLAEKRRRDASEASSQGQTLQSIGREAVSQSTSGDSPSRKEILAEKRRQIAEARRGVASRAYSGLAGKSQAAATERGEESNKTQVSEAVVDEKKKQRLVEAQRLAERSARSREARLAKEAKFAGERQQVELKGQDTSLTEENESPAIEDEEPGSLSSSNAALDSLSPRNVPQSPLVPHMVREADRLAVFIRRYEKKLEAVCKSLLAVAHQYEDDTEADAAKGLPLSDMFDFILRREWYKRTTSSNESRLAFVFSSKKEEVDRAKLTSAENEEKGLGEKVYIVTATGEAFLKMDGPVEADVGRFLSSLHHSSEGLTRTLVGKHWSDVAFLSGDIQSIRVRDKLDELITFCVDSRLIE
jgi:hypothetical protein